MTSQKLLEELYRNGGILSGRDADSLFNDFNWISPFIPLEAEDLGWGYKRTMEDK